MNEKRRVIKQLQVTDTNEIVIRFRGKREAVTARVLERTRDEGGVDTGYLLDRLIHSEGEVFVLEDGGENNVSFGATGCYVTQLTLAI
jgi:hypothetical protein